MIKYLTYAEIENEYSLASRVSVNVFLLYLLIGHTWRPQVEANQVLINSKSRETRTSEVVGSLFCPAAGYR